MIFPHIKTTQTGTGTNQGAQTGTGTARYRLAVQTAELRQATNRDRHCLAAELAAQSGTGTVLGLKLGTNRDDKPGQALSCRSRREPPNWDRHCFGTAEPGQALFRRRGSDWRDRLGQALSRRRTQTANSDLDRHCLGTNWHAEPPNWDRHYFA